MHAVYFAVSSSKEVGREVLNVIHKLSNVEIWIFSLIYLYFHSAYTVQCVLISRKWQILIFIMAESFEPKSINRKICKKELSFCHKLKFSNPHTFEIWRCKPLIFHTYIIWTDRSHSLQCQRSTILGSKDIGIRKSKFVAKTQFLF